ncbi:type I-E CRISPR-associated endoribonuclease Cas2e [Lactobacillus pasteurii]|nr:type I-E CRISPR-associated endoribonuclease Cas2e [Lactobacillus pasteurii]TDG77803.1 hypothetical protein C5L33_000027 [Lactobacillus pasteurii]
MIVVTMTNVPPALRGDLTRWCQEVQTGVYVGNFSARIRDLLWQRILKNIGSGEATMVYNAANELGYNIRTTRSDRKVVDFDGIPFLYRITDNNEEKTSHGFSEAARSHYAKRAKRTMLKSAKSNFVAIDIETTGLNDTDEITAIGAIKRDSDGSLDEFYRLIKIQKEVSKEAQELTGLNREILDADGTEFEDIVDEFLEFIDGCVIVGFNVNFDIGFLNRYLILYNRDVVNQKVIDLQAIAKKDSMFLDDYRLQTVLDNYDIENLKPHNALEDARATYELAKKLMEKRVLKF